MESFSSNHQELIHDSIYKPVWANGEHTLRSIEGGKSLFLTVQGTKTPFPPLYT